EQLALATDQELGAQRLIASDQPGQRTVAGPRARVGVDRRRGQHRQAELRSRASAGLLDQPTIGRARELDVALGGELLLEAAEPVGDRRRLAGPGLSSPALELGPALGGAGLE